MPKVSVIVPSYNLEKTIVELIERCPKSYEIIVVDDGSKDNTFKLAKETRATVLQHKKNLGKGQAMLTGLEKASGDIIVFIDGDLQHLPEDIPRLVEKIADENYDMAMGSRMTKSIKGMPIIRRMSNKISTCLVKLFIDINISDTQNGFRAIKRESLDKMNFKNKGYVFDTEMLVYAAKQKLRIAEVPIEIIYHDTESYFSIKDVFNFLKIVIFK